MVDPIPTRPTPLRQVFVVTTQSASTENSLLQQTAIHEYSSWPSHFRIQLVPRQGSSTPAILTSPPTILGGSSTSTSSIFTFSSSSPDSSRSQVLPLSSPSVSQSSSIQTSSLFSSSSSSTSSTSFSSPSSSSHQTSSSTTSSSSSSPSTSSTTTSSSSSTLLTPLSSTSTTSSTSVSGLTTITSSVVTTIDGRVTTSPIAIPTVLNSTNGTSGASQKTGIIVGSVVGGILFILLLVCMFFLYRRHQARKRGFFPSNESKPRTMLLTDEDMEDDHGYTYPVAPIPPVIQYSDHPLIHQRSSSGDSGLRLMRPRATESGSIFHEGVWPPPGEGSRLVDPIVAANSEVNLSSIVDDIMNKHSQPEGVVGASRLRGGVDDYTQEFSTYSRSYWDDSSQVHEIGQHNRFLSDGSETALLPPAHLAQPSITSLSAVSLVPSRPQPDSYSINSSLNSSPEPKNWLNRSLRKLDTPPPVPRLHLARETPPSSPTVPITKLV